MLKFALSVELDPIIRRPLTQLNVIPIPHLRPYEADSVRQIWSQIVVANGGQSAADCPPIGGLPDLCRSCYD